MHWPEPVTLTQPQPDDGHVMVKVVEYRIDPQHSHQFSEAMQTLRRIRRPTEPSIGACFHDLSRPGRYIETFIEESWVEHLRQHERVSVEDRKVEDRTRTFHHLDNSASRLSFVAET